MPKVLNFKVWRTRVGRLILNFSPSAEVVNDVEKGVKVRICFKTSFSAVSKGNSKIPAFYIIIVATSAEDLRNFLVRHTLTLKSVSHTDAKLDYCRKQAHGSVMVLTTDAVDGYKVLGQTLST